MAPEITTIGIEGPDGLPQWQSPESIEQIFANLKVGDIAHIVPQGEKLQYLLENLGVDQIHGCVAEESTPGKIVLWNTYYAMNPKAFYEDEPRSYTPADIQLITSDKAEEYIKKSTKGKFSYGTQAQVQLPSGVFLITVDSFYQDIISGVTADKQRITGGSTFFTPYL